MCTKAENPSKKTCMQCEHYDYCDIKNPCNGECWNCDIYDCVNNPEYEGE